MRAVSKVSGLALLALAGCAQMMGQTPPPATAASGPLPAAPVFFSPWSAALDGPALAAVAAAAKAANAQPNAPILVTGAADTVGSSDANQDISNLRAEVVAAQLVADGVAASRITKRSLGETAAPGQPGFAQYSRRVTIQIGG